MTGVMIYMFLAGLFAGLTIFGRVDRFGRMLGAISVAFLIGCAVVSRVLT